MDQEYKTLVWTEKSEYRCRYAVIYNNELYECGVPTLLAKTATIESIQELKPTLDLSGVKLISIRVIDTEE